MNNSNKNKWVLFILIVLLVCSSGVFIYAKFIRADSAVNVVTSVEKIDNYGYDLKSNATALYISEFNILKNNLEQSEIDEEGYAKSVAKLFIIDLYTISNKINKYDVGGTQFVFPSSEENYKLNVEDTLYKYVEDNSNNNRKQELPTVSSIEIIDYKTGKYKIGEDEVDDVEIDLKWEYEIDMGYEKEGTVILIKQDSKFYIVEKM